MFISCWELNFHHLYTMAPKASNGNQSYKTQMTLKSYKL